MKGLDRSLALDRSLRELLPVRASNSLGRVDIFTLRDLCGMSWWDLMKIDGVGEESIWYLNDSLQREGFSLKFAVDGLWDVKPPMKIRIGYTVLLGEEDLRALKATYGRIDRAFLKRLFQMDGVTIIDDVVGLVSTREERRRDVEAPR